MTDESEYTKRETNVTNEDGIHARPSAWLVKECNKYKDGEGKPIEIYLARADSPEDRRSCHRIMELMTLEASKGTRLIVYVLGTTAESVQICQEVSDLVSSDFEGASKKPPIKLDDL